MTRDELRELEELSYRFGQTAAIAAIVCGHINGPALVETAANGVAVTMAELTARLDRLIAAANPTA